MTDYETRKKEIAKAVKLVGWGATIERIKSKEDRQIFRELLDEYREANKRKRDKKLKDAGIKF